MSDGVQKEDTSTNWGETVAWTWKRKKQVINTQKYGGVVRVVSGQTELEKHDWQEQSTMMEVFFLSFLFMAPGRAGWSTLAIL